MVNLSSYVIGTVSGITEIDVDVCLFKFKKIEKLFGVLMEHIILSTQRPTLIIIICNKGHTLSSYPQFTIISHMLHICYQFSSPTHLKRLL